MANDNITLDSFKIHDHEHDMKIDAMNVLATIKIGDYLSIAGTVKNNNDLQRRRVSNPSSVYALLKDDLLAGCIVPTIVLALDAKPSIQNKNEEFNIEVVSQAIKNQAVNLKILDGLQRTNILLDLAAELRSTNNKTPDEIDLEAKTLNELLERFLRIEVYYNITRFGILYRMLTLNTGQTPMSLRHQIEILYSDYYIQETEGIKLLRDAFDNPKKVSLGLYRFSDVVEGVTSFIDGSEFTLDRFDLLDYIRNLRKLSTEDIDTDIFISFVKLYHKLLSSINAKSNGWQFSYNNLSQEDLSFFPPQKGGADSASVNRVAPFGESALDIFLKPQVFTGLGAAMSSLKQKGIIKNISDLEPFVNEIKFENEAKSVLDNFVVRLEQIRKESKKIGESQRTFFRFFFTSLFNKNDDDSHLIIDKAIDFAFRKTV